MFWETIFLWMLFIIMVGIICETNCIIGHLPWQVLLKHNPFFCQENARILTKGIVQTDRRTVCAQLKRPKVFSYHETTYWGPRRLLKWSNCLAASIRRAAMATLVKQLSIFITNKHQYEYEHSFFTSLKHFQESN